MEAALLGDLAPAPHVVSARRTWIAVLLDLLICCTWCFWPSALRKPTVAKLRAFAGFPRLLDPFEDRDAFDLLYERQLALARDGSYGYHRLSRLGLFVVAVSALLNIRIRKDLAKAPPVAASRGSSRVHRTRVFIGGPFRTGTTLLQRLLSVNKRCKSFSLREFKNPIEPGRQPIQGLLRITRWLAPHLLSIHPMAIDEPDECIFLLHTSVPLMGLFPVASAVSEWHAELLPHMPAVYECYSDGLERMAGLYASHEESHLILKCPVHGYFIDALHASAIRHVPGTEGGEAATAQRCDEPYCMLRTFRRDLAKVAGSLASLLRAMHDAICTRVDLAAIEEAAVHSVVMQVGQLRRTNELASADRRVQVVDVDFDDLVQRPAATLQAICERLGLPFDAQATADVIAQAERTRKQKDRYASYHSWTLSPRSLERLKACEAEMASLYVPILVS